MICMDKRLRGKVMEKCGTPHVIKEGVPHFHEYAWQKEVYATGNFVWIKSLSLP